jgi:acetyl esterase
MKKLCPEIAGYLKAVRSRPPAHTLSIKELRRDIDKLRDFYPPEPVKRIEDRNIPGTAGDIRVRIYTPEGKGPFPLVVFYHGGGWCIGSLNGYDGICAILTNKIPAVVLSVDYRLAPENVFPAAIDDCYSALKYAASAVSALNADPNHIVVMGDSAGGNLAAAVSVKYKNENGPRIASQILVYPATNLLHLATDSYRLFGKGYDLDREMIEMFRSYYIPDKKDWGNPCASPALAKCLKGLPPTLLITAEFDPLRDDGKRFAEKLKKAGVPVKYSLYKGVIHGFLSFTTFHASQKAFDEINKAVSSPKGTRS